MTVDLASAADEPVGTERDDVAEVDADAPRPKFAILDLIDESVVGMLSRPARAALTALGTVLGVAALVATLGATKTAANQIVARFDALAATEVVIRPAGQDFGFGFGGSQSRTSSIPWDAQDRLERLNGVVAAGTISDVDTGSQLARSVPVNDPLGQGEFQIDVLATSPGVFEAVRADFAQGRAFEQIHSERADPVAVLGKGAAERLGVTRVDNLPAIFIGDQLLVVMGIIDDVARRPELLNSIIIPDGLAQERFGLEAPAEVQIETVVGAAALIGEQAPIALDPNQPDRLDAQVPPEPARTKAEVQQDTQALFLVLGGVSLLVGALGIANVTLVSVMERVGEIGLRRAVGAARRHIAAQFLLESTALGALGGILGTSAGVIVVVAVSAAKQWTPVLDPWLPIAAPIAGAFVGLIAGLYPALKAASVEPIAALRQAL
ncbi:MAG: ABC transporter permease [Acidimicrobiia bacterium]